MGRSRLFWSDFPVGAGAAALLAAKRQDVTLLGAIAGNFDTEAWTQLQGVSPLSESLNPMAVASSLQRRPQRHLSSHADTVIPPEISAKFCKATDQPQICVVVNDVGHGGSWQAYRGYDYQSEK